MKKFIASAIFAFLGTAAYAQTAPGTVVVSGSLSIGINKEESETYNNKRNTFSYYIVPGVGYMLRVGLEVGTSLGFRHAKSEDEGYMYSSNEMPYSSYTNTNSFSVTPYIKKYFMINDKFGLTGSASTSFSTGKSKLEYVSDYTSSVDTKNRDFSIGVSPGLIFFPTEKIGISTALGRLGYSTSTSTTEGENARKSTTSEFGLELNSTSIYLGLSYYINR